MNSATNGVPVNSPDGYDELVYSDVHISDSGEYVHAAPWSVDSQGRRTCRTAASTSARRDAQRVLRVQPRRRRRARRRRPPAAGRRRSRRHGLGHGVERLRARERDPAGARRISRRCAEPLTRSRQAVTQTRTSASVVAGGERGCARVGRAGPRRLRASAPAPSRSAEPDRDEHVHVRPGGHRHRFARLQTAAPQHRVALMDRDRAVVALARRDRAQARPCRARR